MISKKLGVRALTLADYLTLIDAKYKEGVSKGWDRYCTQWGIWSRDMNTEVTRRVRIGLEDDNKALALYSYWVCKSKMLEIKAKGGVIKRVFEYPKLVNEAKDMRSIVMTGQIPEKYKGAFNADR